MHVKVGGAWKNVSGAWVKVAGAWKQVFPGSADFSNTATGTYSSGGINYKYVTFTASGTLTVTQAGLVDVCVVAAGGGAGAGASSQYGGCGGGGGGILEDTFYLDVGTYTIAVGAAGSNAASGSRNAGTQGNDSYIGTDGTIVAFGGGFGSGNGAGGQRRGSRGGSAGGQYEGGINSGVTGQGGSSSNPNYIFGASGGGAGGDAVTGSGTSQGSYGPGRTTSITGSSVEYSRGGGGGGQPKPGTGQKGNGGSAEYGNNNAFEAAQSGEVVVRVKV